MLALCFAHAKAVKDSDTEFAKAKELLLTIMADVTVIDLPHEIVLNALHSKITDI